MRISINGFGRIGRLILRAAIARAADSIEICAINDLFPPENLAYMLKYDSTHGKFNGTVEASDGGITVNGKFIPCTAIRNPEELPWGDLNIDCAIEATGRFTKYSDASKHLMAGAKRVAIAAPSKDPERIPTIVMGVNDADYDSRWPIVSNASCTTNCLAPIAKVIDDNFGLAEGLMTTIHAMTATQPTVDGPTAKDLRSGRGAGQNIIPASTGAAKAVTQVLPQL